jgi:hypothetical protein
MSDKGATLSNDVSWQEVLDCLWHYIRACHLQMAGNFLCSPVP